VETNRRAASAVLRDDGPRSVGAATMRPAARLTDMHACPMVTGTVPHVGGPIGPPCAPTVLVCNLPAARLGDMAVCAGPPDTIATGAPTVQITAQPAARIGDSTAHGGAIVLGAFTVLIA